MKLFILLTLLFLQTLFFAFISTRFWAEYLFSTSQWRESIAANPYDWEHRFKLAWALLWKERPREAAYQFGRVLREVPFNFDAANNLGVAYSRMGQNEKAVKIFQWVLMMWPRHKEARENLNIMVDNQSLIN